MSLGSEFVSDLGDGFHSESCVGFVIDASRWSSSDTSLQAKVVALGCIGAPFGMCLGRPGDCGHLGVMSARRLGDCRRGK